MSREGFKIPLIQIASTVGLVVGEVNVDAIQPLKNGWQIYVKTEKDCINLMVTGIEIIGNSIDLQAPVHDLNNSSVKLVLKDLPLNEVGNDQVLSALKKVEGIDIKSQVKYCNIYIDGRQTHLRNSDRFIYVTPESVSKLGSTMVELTSDQTCSIQHLRKMQENRS